MVERGGTGAVGKLYVGPSVYKNAHNIRVPPTPITKDDRLDRMLFEHRLQARLIRQLTDN